MTTEAALIAKSVANNSMQQYKARLKQMKDFECTLGYEGLVKRVLICDNSRSTKRSSARSTRIVASTSCRSSPTNNNNNNIYSCCTQGVYNGLQARSVR